MFLLFEIFIPWIYSHLLEYVLHRSFLHNPKRKRLFKSHFGDHHKEARKHSMIDTKYVSKISLFGDPELKGLILLMILHIPIFFMFPVAYAVLFFTGIEYAVTHYRSHQDIFWARNNIPWHYDHHMAPDQNANWGVRLPIFDILFGTRKIYKGTKKEVIKFQLTKHKYEKLKEIYNKSV